MPGDAAMLRAVPLFGHLDEPRLSSLLVRSSVRTIATGTPAAVRGEPADRLLVVESGALTGVRETADGRRLRLGEFPAPCTVGKPAVLGAGRHTATWLAAVRTRVRLVPAAELLTLIDDVADVRRHVIAHLARELNERQDDLLRASYGDTSERVAAWLAAAAGRPGARVILPGAQAGLAETLGVSRVSVNRALRSLARAGLVRVEPGAVVVLAPELLVRTPPRPPPARG